jgi:hypothetical protein
VPPSPCVIPQNRTDSFQLGNFKLMIYNHHNILRSITYATEKRRKISHKTENPTPVLSPNISKVVYTSCSHYTRPDCTVLHWDVFCAIYFCTRLPETFL